MSYKDDDYNMSSQTYAQEQSFTGVGGIIKSTRTNYQVLSVLGEGSFGKVVKCVRLVDKKIVAIKIMKKQGNYYARIRKEIQALLKLKELDADRCNIVRPYSSFFDRGNFCFVFEHLDQSLADYIESTNSQPMTMGAIRFIIQQLAVALQSLSSVGLTHCDIKLDNIMFVNHKKQPFRVKLIDFGVATDASTIPMGSVIQALCYRSPEVLLGTKLTEALDMWSLGCVAAKLYLGKRLFNWKSEQGVMKGIIDLVGPPPTQMLDAGIKSEHYFNRDEDGWDCPWHCRTGTSSSERPGQKFPDSLDDFINNLPERMGKMSHVILFVDMLKKMLDIDPAKRITPTQLLQHDFMTNSATVASASRETTTSEEEEQSSQEHSSQESPKIRMKSTQKKRKHDSADEDGNYYFSKRTKKSDKSETAEGRQKCCPGMSQW